MRQVSEHLPPDASLVHAIYELEFRQAVEQRLAELDRGEGVRIQPVQRKVSRW